MLPGHVGRHGFGHALQGDLDAGNRACAFGDRVGYRPDMAAGVDSLLAAVESGLGVALVTARTADRVPKRVQLRALSSAPALLCIAAGHRANRSDDKPLAVFVEELRKAAPTLT